MKKRLTKLTLSVAVAAFTGLAANAQSKSDVSTTKQVDEKKAQKEISSNANQELKSRLKTAKTTNSQSFMSQSEFNARREEIKKNPKKSTKPNRD